MSDPLRSALERLLREVADLPEWTGHPMAGVQRVAVDNAVRTALAAVTPQTGEAQNDGLGISPKELDEIRPFATGITARLINTIDNAWAEVGHARYQLAVRGAVPTPQTGEAARWHGDDICGGDECQVTDEYGDHPSGDARSPDWYDGYAAGQHDAAEVRGAVPEGLLTAAKDAIAFGHNLAMTGRDPSHLGHRGDWTDCPQPLCVRVRDLLEGVTR